MLPVEIVPIDGSTLVLRARGSELLILPAHVGQLKSCKSPKEFTGYFMDEALLNRPARKLFEAWLRKDKSLWQRIYNTIQKEMDASAIEKATNELAAMETGVAPKPAKVAAPAKAEKPAVKKAEAKAPAKTEKPAKAEKPAAKKAEKVAAKEKPAAKKAEAKKPAAKKAAAPTKKPAAKKAAPAKAKAKKKG